MDKMRKKPDNLTISRNTDALIRSSAAEYLTFVASTGGSNASFEMRYEDENIWLTQKMMAALYDVSIAAVNQHLKKIFEDGELDESSVIKKYLITASDGKMPQDRLYEGDFDRFLMLENAGANSQEDKTDTNNEQ